VVNEASPHETTTYTLGGEFACGMAAGRICLLDGKYLQNALFFSRAGFAAGRAEAGGRLRLERQQKWSYLQGVFSGGNGTRTRDLRRDRPARCNRLQPVTTRNHRLEQAFLRFANRL
jgi:hypothetical protein